MKTEEIFQEITDRKWFTPEGSITDERIVNAWKLAEFLNKLQGIYAQETNQKTEKSS